MKNDVLESNLLTESESLQLSKLDLKEMKKLFDNVNNNHPVLNKILGHGDLWSGSFYFFIFFFGVFMTLKIVKLVTLD